MEGIPALVLWDQLLEVLAPKACSKIKSRLPEKVGGWKHPRTALEMLEDIDHVPPTYPMTSGAMKLVLFEDNESVIKMVIKGRSPALGHVPRTHRVDLDWLFERCQYDLAIKIRFVPTKDQLADMLTKGAFAAALWQQQLNLWFITTLPQAQPEAANDSTTTKVKIKRVSKKLLAAGKLWQAYVHGKLIKATMVRSRASNLSIRIHPGIHRHHVQYHFCTSAAYTIHILSIAALWQNRFVLPRTPLLCLPGRRLQALCVGRRFPRLRLVLYCVAPTLT